MGNYDWLNKKYLRSVDQLKLWPQNPRLNPEERHIKLSDYAEDLISEESDKKHFLDLIKSIVDDGFINADPIVIWKNEDEGKYYIAEGNRRILALKLLRDPEKSPKRIRGILRKLAERIAYNSIAKVYVCIAPNFESAEWYINQRNSISTLHMAWSRSQQLRWINELYENHNGDIDKIGAITKMGQGELENYLRILKIRDFIKEDGVRLRLSKELSTEDYEKALSINFPITILERFFNKEVREKWGIEYSGINVIIKSNRTSFLNAYTELIKRILDKDAVEKINTRTITANLERILGTLPTVSFEGNAATQVDAVQSTLIKESSSFRADKVTDENILSTACGNVKQAVKNVLKDGPDRDKLISPMYQLVTDSYRLDNLFKELKRIPFTYPNCIGAAIRVFLDLAVLKYIETETIQADLEKSYKKSLRDISLKSRIEYIKSNYLKKQTILNLVSRLLDPHQQYSLDVLNGYMHGHNSNYLSKQFLNGFWDTLLPFFQFLLDIREV